MLATLAVNGTSRAPLPIAVTALLGNETWINFDVVGYADFTSTDSTRYTLTLSTNIGHIEIPQLGGYLMLTGRDSKFHVTDYDVGCINPINSSIEIFTYARGSGSTIILESQPSSREMASKYNNKFALAVQWHVTPARRIVRVADLQAYLLWRNEAYSYWVMELPVSGPIGNYSSLLKSLVVVNAGYLIRAADLINKQRLLTGDVNSTTEIEVIFITATKLKGITFNGEVLHTSKTSNWNLWGSVRCNPPKSDIPDLSNLKWKFIDSLPEIQASYDDSAWKPYTKISKHDPRQLETPSSLYSMNCGSHIGSLLYRGHLNANGQESNVLLNVSGELNLGSPFVIKVLIDHIGQDEETPGIDTIKVPPGILNYRI
ncbi:Beta-galactosidase, domain 2 [Penicillium italicum]|uniref:Beta-galactosidase, domain 2 n=1 Tax=Penicillium italicum TaxID=40296 RepID=A0A0A2LPK9_PENIT|nr:Beta-galactosidase, domain 2 [Penicillium italicum]